MKALAFALSLPRRPTGEGAQQFSMTSNLGDLRVQAPRLWRSDNIPVRGAGQAIWVIGHVFDSNGCTPGALMTNSGLQDVPDCSFVRQYWGAYFVVRHDLPSGRWFGFTEPSGLFPVYRKIGRDHVLLSSHPRLFEKICSQNLTPDIESLRQHLLFPDIRLKATCLHEVDELPPGYVCDLSESQTGGRPIWSPAMSLPGRALPSYEDACEELRDRATSALRAWTGALGPVAVAVSGGVDSSFICGALAEAGASFGCVTLATSDSSGDESDYAKLLASHINRPLVVKLYQPNQFDPFVTASADLPRPSRRSFLTEVDRLLLEGARELGAAVILDGNAGDNLFCFLHSADPPADHIRCTGLNAASVRTLVDMCRITESDLPAMIKAVARKLVWPVEPFRCRPNTSLLSPSLAFDSTAHPLVSWHNEDVGRHRGKLSHIRLILGAQNHIHPATFSGARMSPLVSQPILEWCLSVPTWVWVRGGINRAPARDAFGPLMPVEIRHRVSKAGPDSFIRQAFSLNRHKLRELLIEGILAAHKIIDLPSVERAFETRSDDSGDMIYRLLDLAEAENWARSWST